MSIPVMDKVICCAQFADPAWRWIESGLADMGVGLEFARCSPRYAFEMHSRFNIARVRGSLEAVRMVRRFGAKALVAHGPTLGAWCGLFARILRVRVPLFVTLNFPEMPSAAKRLVFALAFTLARVDRAVVYSTMERELYSRMLRIPPDRIDVVLWAVEPPDVEARGQAIERGEYVCAIGGNGRDYPALMEVARKLPQIRFVIVVRPQNLHGLTVPANVTVHTDIPLGRAMNILLHSRFMVLPLAGAEVPCGHVTLVAAMHLGKAFVITNSTGVRDYVRDGENALTAAAGSIDSLVAATRRLWEDPGLCERLGEDGRRFAVRECSEERIVDHFRTWLGDKCIGQPQEPSSRLAQQL